MPQSTQPNPAEPLTDEERAAVLDPVNHPQGFVSVWTRSFAIAAAKAREENARLGIDTPCAENGVTGVLTPNGKFVPKKFEPS